MAGEKKVEKPDAAAAMTKSDPSTKLSGQDLASGKDGVPGVPTSFISSSVDGTPGIKGGTGQESVGEQGGYYPPTSCYDYYYPGYNGNFTQLDNQNFYNAGDGSYTGFQSDNGSLLYYMPGYDPYTGSYMGVDGQQSYYSPTGYLQQPAPYGSEAMQCYSWDSTYVGDVANGTAGILGKSKPASGTNASAKFNNYNSLKSNGNFTNKFSTLPLDSKGRKSPASSNYSKSFLDSQPLKSLGKFGSGYQSAGLVKGLNPVNKFSSYVNQNQGLFMHNGPMNYRPSGRVWNGNSKFNFRDRNGEYDASAELKRGPRGTQKASDPSNPAKDEQPEAIVSKEKYNLQDFKTEYEDAKFFVIKSYSEDDIHKSIKYDVWSSTPNGNKKLDAAYRAAESTLSETGKKCPIFLFFSVNASGQFVGIAEMVGPVDYKKDMDFWQLDKWSGFFPVKWHIIKDVPNTQLRHIILENNDNRPVTYSRDTQEIGLNHGIEMLNIFKGYSEKTSVLDDFNFYEDREKSLKAKRIPSLQADNHSSTGERTEEAVKGSSDPTVSLISLTKNLSLGGASPVTTVASVVNPRENSIPAAITPSAAF